MWPLLEELKTKWGKNKLVLIPLRVSYKYAATARGAEKKNGNIYILVFIPLRVSYKHAATARGAEKTKWGKKMGEDQYTLYCSIHLTISS